jgi:tRNA 2-thiouridine synthesizing protein E
MRELDQEFAAEGGRRYLYDLFPRGPILQASRIAGLPLPPGTLDRSFGSVH